ncbi:MAG TPA: hypothetical protein VGM90_14105 [Kofleriaceae bacterium]|jgi:hypothetical protein
MSDEINNWLNAYLVLREVAIESRGIDEIDVGADVAPRWPRTTGADVIAIAAFIDPFVRAQPLRFGGQGLARRWRVCIDGLANNALVTPSREYTDNRAFWTTLPAMFVYLHAQGAELPDESTWDALFSVLEDNEHRNAGPSGDGPFQHFDGIKTFDDLYIAQFKYLRDARGSDIRDQEAGMTGGTTTIPRTTNADVIALVDYWSKQLANAREIMGAAGVVAKWKAATDDVQRIARQGDPNAVYTKNNGFWRALKTTAIHVALADEAPTMWDLAFSSIKDSVTHLPENLATGASVVASAAGDVAQSIGKVANEAGKGLFSGFGTPLLVGAGLVGLLLISRGGRRAEA